MKYIITGHKGLIGESLKKELDKDNECVLEIDSRAGESTATINYYHNKKADIFFHLAARCKINKIVENPNLAFENVRGVINCLEYCRLNKIKKFVYFSSSRVLSKEENPYTAGKKYGENLCEAYRQCYGIDYLIIRPSTVYGEQKDTTSRLTNDWVRQALKNEPLIIYGDEKKTLDFTHVDDFVDGIMILLDNWDKTKNQAYDISGDEEVRLVDLAEMIREEIDKYNLPNRFFKVEFHPQEIAQPQNIKIDIIKMKKLGFKPKIKLKEGVKRLVKFYG